MGTALVITSGKGGVGKTTLTANLGVALAQRKKRVVLLDADIGLRNLDVVMGLENRIVFDVVDVARGICRLAQALVRDKRYSGLYLLPAAQAADKNTLTAEQMRDVVVELKREFDFVLIDCPAGIEQGYQNAVAGADQAIVVVIPEVSSVRDADRVIGLLAAQGIHSPFLVVNRYQRAMVRRGDMMDADDIMDVLGIDLLGVVAEDPGVIKASNLGSPLAEGNTAAGFAVRELAAKLCGDIVREHAHGTWGSRIKRLFMQGQKGAL
ncbi:MAG: septum site-determining protein MinD [Christensenellales bacterium]|jgi:septum site-determining protein MinD